MRIRSLILAFTFVLFSFSLFIACDDKLNEIGVNIQPDDDDILAIMDTLGIFPETVSMNDSVYGWSTIGLLGRFDDPLFGTTKVDYLTEFYCPEDSLYFEEGKRFAGIDSVKMNVIFSHFYGDTLAPMGLSVYKVTSPLKRDYFTNVDPSNFCDMTNMLGQKTYTINQAEKVKVSSTLYRILSVHFDKTMGEEFYDEWKNGEGFQNTNKLREYFPGVYVTTTFGSGSLIEAEMTSINVYYKYEEELSDSIMDSSGDFTGDFYVRDTTYTSTFTILVTPEVIKLNHVKNTFAEPNPLLTDENALYIKTPAGVYPQIQFDLQGISEEMNSYGDERLSVNSGKLIIKGYSEMEELQEYNFGRSPYLLLIDTDSLENFFLRDNPLPNNTTSFYTIWDETTNSYSFTNLASMITTYKDKISDGLDKEPTFALIPIDAEFSSSSTSTSSTLISISNYMSPATSIIRKDKENLRFSYIISKY